MAYGQVVEQVGYVVNAIAIELACSMAEIWYIHCLCNTISISIRQTRVV